MADDRIIAPEPLTAAAFAPFGDVLEAAGASFPINGGMVDRFHDRARIEVVDGRVLTPLGRATSFLIVDRIGVGANLEEYRYDRRWIVQPG